MISLFDLVKWLHVVSSTVLFGLGLGTAYYKLQAWRSGDPVIAAAVGRMVVKADWMFTATAGVAQPLTGAALILMAGWDPRSGWLILTYALYLLAFACWAPVVVLQIQAMRLAEAAIVAGERTLPSNYHRRMRVWLALGWPAFIALLIIFYLMVAKPDVGF